MPDEVGKRSKCQSSICSEYGASALMTRIIPEVDKGILASSQILYPSQTLDPYKDSIDIKSSEMISDIFMTWREASLRSGLMMSLYL